MPHPDHADSAERTLPDPVVDTAVGFLDLLAEPSRLPRRRSRCAAAAEVESQLHRHVHREQAAQQWHLP